MRCVQRLGSRPAQPHPQRHPSGQLVFCPVLDPAEGLARAGREEEQGPGRHSAPQVTVTEELTPPPGQDGDSHSAVSGGFLGEHRQAWPLTSSSPVAALASALASLADIWLHTVIAASSPSPRRLPHSPPAAQCSGCGRQRSRLSQQLNNFTEQAQGLPKPLPGDTTCAVCLSLPRPRSQVSGPFHSVGLTGDPECPVSRASRKHRPGPSGAVVPSERGEQPAATPPPSLPWASSESALNHQTPRGASVGNYPRNVLSPSSPLQGQAYPLLSLCGSERAAGAFPMLAHSPGVLGCCGSAHSPEQRAPASGNCAAPGGLWRQREQHSIQTFWNHPSDSSLFLE